MTKSFLRVLIICALLVPMAAPGRGASADPSGVVPLELTADRPVLQAAGAGQRVVPRIRKFGLSSRPGEPMLPIRVLLVAIPAGSVPGLRIIEAPSEVIRGIDVAPVPRSRVRDRALEGKRQRAGRDGPALTSEAGDDFATDDTIYGRAGDFPGAPVRLGRIGYLREQRYVEVLYAPALFDPSRRQLRFFPRIRAEVHFGLSDTALASAEKPFLADPLFEETYRHALVNYEQGKLFRVSAGQPIAATEQQIAASESIGPLSATCSPIGSAPPPAPSAPPPAGPRYKLLVSRAGVYRLDYDTLAASAPELIAADPRTLMLTAEGVEVPISIRNAAGASGEADGSFDRAAGDFLEFVGGPKREAPTALNFCYGTTFPDVFEANDFTDTQVYWLSATGAAGSHLRIPSASGAPVNAFPVAPDFAGTAVWEENNIYLPLGDAEPFFSIPSLLADSPQSQRDVSLALPGIAPGSATVTVTARLRGGTDLPVSPDHRTAVWINGDTADRSDVTWDGDVIQEQTFTLPQSVLSNPTTIHLSAPGGLTGVNVDRQYPDKVTVQYRRLFTASGDALSFDYPNQNTRFQIGGFSAAPGVIYEVTRTRPGSNEADPVLLTGATSGGAPGATTYAFDVPLDSSAPGTRSFMVGGPGAILKPDAIVRAADPVLRDPTLAADLIVIAARGTIDPSPGGALDALLAHRLATQGLTSTIVYMDQIYDEFSYGLRDPNAIRAFLAYAFDNWKGSGGVARPPAFVLLVGDASPDYKNTLQSPDWVDQVPTPMMFQVSSIFGYYSSDNWLASFRGIDQVPDLYLGRISTRNATDAAAVFDKIRRYEESPAPGLWKGHAILAAGDGKFAGEADQFESVQTQAATLFVNPPYSTPSPPLYFDNAPWLGSDAAGFTNALLNEIGAGAILLSFVGHGSFETWGNNTIFTAENARSLTNAPLLPFVVNVNCLAGGFHYLVASGSMGEALTNNPAGGAIATFAPSGLSNIYVGPEVETSLLTPLFGPVRERLLSAGAQAVRSALWSEGSVVDLQSFTFLGDPATLLATPAPPPPTNLAAVAGNAQVSLSWTPPAASVSGTRIYRAASNPSGTYAPIPCDPVSATACVDRGVINATTYYYYAVSIDAEGFGGRASNFNSDCATSGPDCVSARPLNPGAPAAPRGLIASDPGSGGRLQVAWSASPESDLKVYTLYYGAQPGTGTVPGTYTSRIPVSAATTSLTLTGLTDSVRYYMVLTATNTSGNESAPSSEASNVPHLIQGIAPPRAITDLSVSRSGADLVLGWSRPLVDIYGRPTTIAKYNVYRGATPGFQPFSAPPLATIGDPAVTTFRDPGAATAAGNEYYLVTAIDTAGLMSGAGRELPNGVDSLGLSLPASGTIRLAWSAVTTDMQGLPTVLDHYQIYMSSRPLPRSSLSSSTLVMDNVTALSVDLPAGSGPLFFSVIAVDDRGNLSPF